MSAPQDDCNVHGAQPLVYEEIMLGKKPPALQIKHARIPIDQVDFDAANPRNKYRKERFPGKSDSELLFEDNDTKWLQKDIAENGVLDPIYVRVRTDSAAYGYTVVEGNRRTACVKELHKKNPNEQAFCTIPARILPAETTESQEALLMASFHVAGKLIWDAHEKAGHVWRMLHDLKIPENELSVTLHMGVPAIKRTAESFGLLEYFKKVEDGKYASGANGKWSFFAEMMKHKDLRERHEKDQSFIDEYCRWVGEGRLPRAENVRDLPKILSTMKARKIFLDETVDPEKAFDAAKKIIDKGNPSRNSKFFAQIEKLVEAGKAASMADITEAGTNDVARDQVLEAFTVLSNFIEQAGLRTPRRAA